MRLPMLFMAGLLAACASGQPAGEASARGGKPSFEQWLTAFQGDAVKRGISRSTLRLAFRGVKYDPKVIEFDNFQPEFVKPIGSYVKIADGPRDRRSRAAVAAPAPA